jgi:fatty-acyl-CoA synthase
VRDERHARGVNTPSHLLDLRLGDLPARAALQWGSEQAVHFIEPNGTIQSETYTEFADNVDRVAKGLVALGVESGDHVGVWMTNRPEWLHLMYAVGKVGGCLVPLNTRYRSDDMAFTVVNAECAHLITIDQSGPINYRSLLAEARAEIEAAGHLRSIVMMGEQLDGSTSWEQMLDAGQAITGVALAERAASVDPDQLMMLACTRIGRS